MTSRLLPAMLLAVALASAARPAAAQNGFSFLDASRSAIDYRVASAAPRLPCRALAELSGGELTVVSAQEVPASQNAPAHCRVLGVIQPEVQFEVALPAAWNRRLYMRGNGAGTRDFFRLFMVPGMFHCRGGFGPDRLDALTPLINWVEGGRAPEAIVAAQEESGAIVRTRPLCPYPRVARLTGSGNASDASSFVCRDP